MGLCSFVFNFFAKKSRFISKLVLSTSKFLMFRSNSMLNKETLIIKSEKNVIREGLR